jgi:hypothetical protein
MPLKVSKYLCHECSCVCEELQKVCSGYGMYDTYLIYRSVSIDCRLVPKGIGIDSWPEASSHFEFFCEFPLLLLDKCGAGKVQYISLYSFHVLQNMSGTICNVKVIKSRA